jgi:4-amino-4-deoxy-L-arabinose transferase-like glycosyltransferase
MPALGAFALSLLLDLRTIMPGLGFWDTAEFQALGPVLGIAHPTGYPSYTLLLWLASVVLQPLGEAAFRANLTSALLTSGAAALTAVAVTRLTRHPGLGLVAGIALAVSPIVWRNALRADPHPFHLFLAALMLVLLLVWAERERTGRPAGGRYLIAAAAVFAVALGNHALTLLLAPGIGLYVFLVQPHILWRRWRLVLGCALVLVGLTVALYAYLPLRSAMGPPLD